MESNPESHADIVKEMREFALEREYSECAPSSNRVVGSDMRMFAKRLEAAHKREVAKLVSNLDALEKAMERVCSRDAIAEIITVKKEIQNETK